MQAGQTQITATPVKLTDLPAGRNHHWTKSLVASPDGTKLYVGVGSNSNVADFGMGEEAEPREHSRDRPHDRRIARLCGGDQEPGRLGLEPRKRQAVGLGQ
jgi:glucose/arabinose dehydrogenase